MIFEIPICDKLSDYVPKAWDEFNDHFPTFDDEAAFELFTQPFTFSGSIKFDVTYDDYDSPLHKEGHYPATTLAGYLLSGSPPVVFVVFNVSVCRVGLKIV